MCPRISVPTSFSSSSSSSLPSPFLSLLLYTTRLLAVHVCARTCIYLQKKKRKKKILPPPYMREAVNYPPAPTLSFSLSSFSYGLRAQLYIYLYLSPPTTYTPPSSRRTTGIISVFPQTRLTRNVVQQALRALSTGRDILLLRLAVSISLSCSLALPSAFDSTPSIDNSRLILRESGLLPLAAAGLLRVHGEFRGSR